MDQNEIIDQVPGAQGLVDLYTCWPSFHDAEVVSLELNRQGRSRIKVHTFATMKEIDSRGYYVTDKHTLVSFLLEGVSSLQLNGFNHQNVIFGIDLKRTLAGYELLLEGCYGIEGRIECAQLFIEIEPWMQPQSIYADSTQT
jgi:Immunity protein 50